MSPIILKIHSNYFLYNIHRSVFLIETYRGADKSLVQPGRKQATATKF